VSERSERQRWARLHFEHRNAHPAKFLGQWLRVVERHLPDVPSKPNQIWLDLAGEAHEVEGTHFEIVQRGRQRIVVVDDEPGIRQTLDAALTKAGYEVFQARDGEEGTMLWREKGPDLIIADIHMPRKSGLLLLQELQEHTSSTRAIAMSDGGPAQNLTLLGLAGHLGAFQTIAKPFSLDEMLGRVKAALGSS
jgi:CheY-like chemotaxis protein